MRVVSLWKEMLMFKQNNHNFWPVLLIVTVSAVALLLLVALSRAATSDGNLHSGSMAPASIHNQMVPRYRNLSKQPEAFKLSRKLGRRFASQSRVISSLTGSLTIGTQTQSVTIVRRQTERGERVEIARAGGSALLTWSEAEGPRSSGETPGEAERILIERLALDSAEQLVLAQLRGVSYYMVGRNVRSNEAGDSDAYDGPVWDVLRIDDPEQDQTRKPLSSWRLYYLNTRTGLVDKIAYDLHGQRIEAHLSGWTDHAGERVPSQINWTRGREVLMEFRLISFTVLASS